MGYRASVERNGRGWAVSFSGAHGFPGVLPVPELVDVDVRLRRYIFGYTGVEPHKVELDIDVILPQSIQVRLELAEDLCRDADLEVAQAIAELVEVGATLRDVEWILARRRLDSTPEISA